MVKKIKMIVKDEMPSLSLSDIKKDSINLNQIAYYNNILLFFGFFWVLDRQKTIIMETMLL